MIFISLLIIIVFIVPRFNCLSLLFPLFTFVLMCFPHWSSQVSEIPVTYITELRCRERRDILAGSEGQPG